MLADELLRALDEKAEAALRPVFLVVGEEGYFADAVTRALRAIATKDGLPGFNDDKFTAGECSVEAVIDAAQSMPMMARRRFVLVRNLDKWGGGQSAEGAPAKASKDGPLDKLAAYAADPNPSTVLVLVATKLHAQRKLVTLAKKAGFIVTCDPVRPQMMAPFLIDRARRLGHAMARDLAEHAADLLGTDLGAAADAVERMGLFVGAGAPLTEEAVVALIAPVQKATIWELTDAVCARDLSKALRAMEGMDIAREELRVLGAIASSVRKLARFEEALANGEPAARAAEIAAIPPFKAMAMQAAVRRLPRGTLARWLVMLADADVAMKGGAKRPARAVLDGLVFSMCAG
ncbi:MAG: DNA polymerase III subunit delta [Polyangiaceae bacterium]